LQVFKSARSKGIFALIGGGDLKPGNLGVGAKAPPQPEPSFQELKQHDETTPSSLAHPSMPASHLRNPVKPEVANASCVAWKFMKGIRGLGLVRERLVAPVRDLWESHRSGRFLKLACFPRRTLKSVVYAWRKGDHCKLLPLRKLIIGVGSFTFFVTATSFHSLAADDCEAIADAHAYNYCLAAKGPVYKPRRSTSSAPPQDNDASRDEGTRQAEPGDVSSAMLRAPPPRYPKYLNAVPTRPPATPRQHASAFSLKGR